MRLAIRTGAIATLSIAAMSLGTPLALAHGGNGGSTSGGGSYGASHDRGDGRGGVRAASYINPDTGAATENPDVDRNSSCTNPTSATSSGSAIPAPSTATCTTTRASSTTRARR